MAQPYIGEIRMFGGNFAPAGWMFCDGALLPIAEYETLFMLIGTTYGGDGQSTFGLPDLRGRLPLHFGTGAGISVQLSETGGAETVTLTTAQIPSHTHAMLASTNIGQMTGPRNNLTAQNPAKPYRTGNASVFLHPASVAPAGGAQPHNNFQPYLCVSFIISLFGIFPSPT